MSAINLTTASCSQNQINERALFQEIKKIEDKVIFVLKKTAWVNIEQAQRASTYAKFSWLKIGKIYYRMAEHYYKLGGDHNNVIANQHWEDAIKSMQQYSHYPSMEQDIDYKNWLNLSTLYCERIKFCFNRQLNIKTSDKKDLLYVQKKIDLINEGLNAVNQALAIKSSYIATFQKFFLLRSLNKVGGNPPESPVLWLKLHLDNHPNPNSEEYFDHARIYGSELIENGKLDEAKLWLTSLVQKQENPFTYLCLGKVEDELNNTERAVSYFKKAYDLAPDNIEIKLWFVAGQVKDIIRKFSQFQHQPMQAEIEESVRVFNEFCSTFSQLLTDQNPIDIPLEELAGRFYLTLLPEMANILTHLQQFSFALELYKSVLQNIEIYLKLKLLSIPDVATLDTTIGGLYLQLTPWASFNRSRASQIVTVHNLALGLA